MKFFMTGTDTEVGKTYVARALLKQFHASGYSTLGLKPLASGGNSDVKILKEASSIKLPFSKLNAFCFNEAVAPHFAAQKAGVPLSVHLLRKKMSQVLAYPADVIVIEGVGGWHVPLNDKETMADFVNGLSLTVILVVRIRLGCLNHAILSNKAISTLGVKLGGWIANNMDNDPRLNDMIATLKAFISAPFLGCIPFQEKTDDKININPLLF